MRGVGRDLFELGVSLGNFNVVNENAAGGDAVGGVGVGYGQRKAGCGVRDCAGENSRDREGLKRVVKCNGDKFASFISHFVLFPNDFSGDGLHKHPGFCGKSENGSGGSNSDDGHK